MQHPPQPGACEGRCSAGMAIIDRCSACAFHPHLSVGSMFQRPSSFPPRLPAVVTRPQPGACESRCPAGITIIDRCNACAFYLRTSPSARYCSPWSVFPVEFYRPGSSRNCSLAVRSRPVLSRSANVLSPHFTVPSRFGQFPRQTSSNCPVTSRHGSQSL